MIERTVPPECDTLYREKYKDNSTFSDSMMYSAYESGYHQEYDWNEYVALNLNERSYQNCAYENGFYYSVHDNTATVHGADAELFADAESVMIPDTLEYIDSMAFYDQSVTLQLEDDPQHTFVSDARLGQRPYQVTEDRTEPLSADYYPDIVLLGMPFSASEMRQAGDLNSDSILNAADLTLLKRSLLHDDP